MVDKFLVLLSMENMAKAFIEHQISGAVLLALTEEHMKELTCAVLGQRVLFLEYLAVLKRHKRDADRSKTLWSVTTPEWGKQSHHHRCTGFCFQVRLYVCVSDISVCARTRGSVYRHEWTCAFFFFVWHNRIVPGMNACACTQKRRHAGKRCIHVIRAHST